MTLITHFNCFTIRSKQEGVKLTSILNTIAWIAIFRLYKRHNSHLDEILAWIAVSLSRFRPEIENNKYMLAYCVGAFFVTFSNTFENVLDDSEVLRKFWPLARENDEILSDKVENDMEKFGMKLKTPFIGDEMAIHIGLSNAGRIDANCLKGGMFSIENVFIKGCIPQTNVRNLFYNLVSSIDNKICWAIASNSYFFDHILVDEFIDLFNEFLLKLID